MIDTCCEFEVLGQICDLVTRLLVAKDVVLVALSLFNTELTLDDVRERVRNLML